MTTPTLAIQPAAPLRDSPAPSRKSESSSPDNSFNQVLSREMADKQQGCKETDNASRPSSRPEGSKPAEPAQPASKTASNGDKGTDGKTSKVDKDSEKDESSGPLAGAMTASAEMMALIAGATQAAPAQGVATPAAGNAEAKDIPADAALLQPAAVTASAAEHGAKTKALIVADDKSAAKADLKPEELNVAADDAAAGEKASAKDFAKDLRVAADATAKAVEEKMQPVETAKSSNAASTTLIADGAATSVHQLAAARAVHASAAANGDHLAPRVGTPGWDNALSQKVVWMVAGEQQSASLTLNPPDLGPLQVVLNVSNSMANATFIAAQPEVKQAIENALPKLREMMSDAGIQLGQASVSTGMPNQQRDTSGDGSRALASSGSGSLAADAVEGILPTARTSAVTSGQGLVDTFV